MIDSHVTRLRLAAEELTVSLHDVRLDCLVCRLNFLGLPSNKRIHRPKSSPGGMPRERYL